MSEILSETSSRLPGVEIMDFDLTAPQVIHVDFEIDHRDLFRMNLGLVKWRLLAGILFSLILIGGLIFFFTLIDAQEILLQTSPLFIGIPLLAIGAQVLRLHATCRKFVAGLTESQRRVQYMFQTDSDGFDVVSGESFGHISWSDISRVSETDRCFVLFQTRLEGRVLMKRGFHQQTDMQRLREILVSRLGERAKVLNH